MNWEQLTAPAFAKAVTACGRTCVISVGVVEKHGDHLPIGEDAIIGHAIATRAAEIETAMVFPNYIFGQNTHAKCEPGAIAIPFALLHPLLEAVCDEIARNGFNKIIAFSPHGGNHSLLNLFCEKMLDAEKPFAFYHANICLAKIPGPRIGTASVDGHGGEGETSMMLALHPEWVTATRASDYGLPLKREAAFRDRAVMTPSWWYADHPGMLMGDQTEGTAEKGEKILERNVAWLADIIRTVKNDEVAPALYREFHGRCKDPCGVNG